MQGKLTAIPSIPTDGFECYWIRDEAGADVGTVSGPQSPDNEKRAKIMAASPVLFQMVEAFAVDHLDVTRWPEEQLRGWATAVARTASDIVSDVNGEII